jgi:hypothetical protein
MVLDLTPVWAALLALAVLMYVLLDGFDLGVGFIVLLRKDDRERDLMMNSVAPVWDFNETWLVIGGTALMAVIRREMRRCESFSEFVSMRRTRITTARCAARKRRRPVRELNCGSSAED